MQFPDNVRAVVAKQALEIHLRTKGKMRLTRVSTPSEVLRIVGSITNKNYKVSPKGMNEALADVTKYLEDSQAEYEVQDIVRVREVPYPDGDATRSQLLIYSNVSARDAIVNGLLLMTGRAGDLSNQAVRQEVNEQVYRKGSCLFLKQGKVELFCVLNNVIAKERSNADGNN